MILFGDYSFLGESSEAPGEESIDNVVYEEDDRINGGIASDDDEVQSGNSIDVSDEELRDIRVQKMEEMK